MIGYIPAVLMAVSISASPRVCNSPCTISVTVTVPKHEDNRTIEIDWADEGGELGSEELDLNVHSPVQFVKELTVYGNGLITFQAIVHRTSGTFIDRVVVRVVNDDH